MNTNLLMQLLQSMSGDMPQQEEAPCQINLPPHFEMMLSMRHMFPPKEQKMIDLLVKMFELQVLMDEVMTM